MSSKVLIALGSCYGAHKVFQHLFNEVVVCTNIDQVKKRINKNSVVMFGGGEDISPSLYKEDVSRYTSATKTRSHRDQFEELVFQLAKEQQAVMYGICRGAQMICALSGGKLVQHVRGHGSDHDIVTKDGETYYSSSVHHQMMYPNGIKHELIAWAAPRRSDVYVLNDQHVEKEMLEPEIIYFPESRALGVQGHPEFMTSSAPFVKYNEKLLKEYLL